MDIFIQVNPNQKSNQKYFHRSEEGQHSLHDYTKKNPAKNLLKFNWIQHEFLTAKSLHYLVCGKLGEIIDN